jgi:hypothetical protein
MTKELLSCPTVEFSCPGCAQPLECGIEDSGREAPCPTCGASLTIPFPAGPEVELPAQNAVKHWTVDVRVLVPGVPPIYLKMLMEVPKTWVLTPAGGLPHAALDAVTRAAKSKYPNRPITPSKVRIADADALKRKAENCDYSDGCCKVWALGIITMGA